MKKFFRYFFIDHFFATLWTAIGIAAIAGGYRLICRASEVIATHPVQVVFRADGTSEWFTLRTEGSADLVLKKSTPVSPDKK